ncbi:MAG: hypothetical protein J6B92_05355 [Paraprevotella sp.]|nr:hypothetical protein [Paraprevotella sp.]
MIDFNDYNNNISDEMLAAYIDGKAIPIEKNIIGNYSNDERLQELLEIVSDIKANPELIDAGEYLQGEIPDKLFEAIDNSFQEIKRYMEETDKNVM